MNKLDRINFTLADSIVLIAFILQIIYESFSIQKQLFVSGIPSRTVKNVIIHIIKEAMTVYSQQKSELLVF